MNKKVSKKMTIDEFKNQKTNKKPDYYKRFENCLKNGFNNNHLDRVEKNDKNTTFYLNDVAILSNNDLLRIHYKRSYKYRELWKDRISDLIKKNKLNLIEKKVIIEVIYIKTKNKILDYDASISCLKYIIDGIVKSGLIKDDTINEIPLINTRTIHKKDEFDRLIINVKEIDSDSELDNFFSENLNYIYHNEKESK